MRWVSSLGCIVWVSLLQDYEFFVSLYKYLLLVFGGHNITNQLDDVVFLKKNIYFFN